MIDLVWSTKSEFLFPWLLLTIFNSKTWPRARRKYKKRRDAFLGAARWRREKSRLNGQPTFMTNKVPLLDGDHRVDTFSVSYEHRITIQVVHRRAVELSWSDINSRCIEWTEVDDTGIYRSLSILSINSVYYSLERFDSLELIREHGLTSGAVNTKRPPAFSIVIEITDIFCRRPREWIPLSLYLRCNRIHRILSSSPGRSYKRPAISNRGSAPRGGA